MPSPSNFFSPMYLYIIAILSEQSLSNSAFAFLCAACRHFATVSPLFWILRSRTLILASIFVTAAAKIAFTSASSSQVRLATDSLAFATAALPSLMALSLSSADANISSAVIVLAFAEPATTSDCFSAVPMVSAVEVTRSSTFLMSAFSFAAFSAITFSRSAFASLLFSSIATSRAMPIMDFKEGQSSLETPFSPSLTNTWRILSSACDGKENPYSPCASFWICRRPSVPSFSYFLKTAKTASNFSLACAFFTRVVFALLHSTKVRIVVFFAVFKRAISFARSARAPVAGSPEVLRSFFTLADSFVA
mmetsp:Transcript_106562/g.168344  ORF Transcript_106562/g.168344 Transcript_106562/m.168344 type:complete len:307 (+) Transcript_106562:864-1784(+)